MLDGLYLLVGEEGCFGEFFGFGLEFVECFSGYFFGGFEDLLELGVGFGEPALGIRMSSGPVSVRMQRSVSPSLL